MTDMDSPKLVMKIESGSPVYVFTLQARPTDGGDVAADGSSCRSEQGSGVLTLALEQIEAARNAAVAALNLVGVEIDSTSSVLTIDAPSESSRIVLTADIQPLSTIAQTSPENESQEP